MLTYSVELFSTHSSEDIVAFQIFRCVQLSLHPVAGSLTLLAKLAICWNRLDALWQRILTHDCCPLCTAAIQVASMLGLD